MRARPSRVCEGLAPMGKAADPACPPGRLGGKVTQKVNPGIDLLQFLLFQKRNVSQLLYCQHFMMKTFRQTVKLRTFTRNQGTWSLPLTFLHACFIAYLSAH